MRDRTRLQTVSQELRTQAIVLGGLIAIMWALEILDWIIFGGLLDGFGVRPRTVIGLRGILFAPFLHVGFGHLMANTIPFLVLGWLVMMRELRQFVLVSLIVGMVSGLGIWLTGSRNSVHIGASGLIFGYFGFILWRGYFERSARSIFLSIVVGVLYGSLIFGVLPQGNHISWQAHLFGFIGGALAAYWLTEQKRQKSFPRLADDIHILD